MEKKTGCFLFCDLFRTQKALQKSYIDIWKKKIQKSLWEKKPLILFITWKALRALSLSDITPKIA